MKPEALIQPFENIVRLHSPIFFFESFVMKSNNKSQTRIPNTIVCQNGELKDWLFNSEKEKNHPVLKKHKENVNSLKIVKSILYSQGCYDLIAECSSVQEIYDKLQDGIKSENTQVSAPLIKCSNNTVLILYKGSKQPKPVRIHDFVKTLANRSYSVNFCPQSWRLIVQKPPTNNNKLFDQYFYVQALKPSQLLNLRFSFLKRTVHFESQQGRKILQQKIFQIGDSDKNITKVYDQSITNRMLSLSVTTIQFLQQNFKISVKDIIIKCILNRQKQPIFMGILSLFIRVPAKFFQAQEIKKSSTLQFTKYLQIYDKLKNLPQLKSPRKKMSSQVSQSVFPSQKIICQGDFCQALLKNQFERRVFSPTSRSNEISHSFVIKVRKNMKNVIQKLKQMGILSINSSFQKHFKGHHYQHQEEMDHSMRKMCKKCYFIYSAISKVTDFEFVDTKSSAFDNSASKNLLSIISKTTIKNDLFNKKKINSSNKPFTLIKQIFQQTQQRSSNKNFIKVNIEKLQRHRLPVIQNTPNKNQEQSLSKLQLPLKQPKPQIIKSKSSKKSNSTYQPRTRVASLASLPKKSQLPSKTQIKQLKQPVLNKPVNQIQANKKLMTNVQNLKGYSVPQLKQKHKQYYLDSKLKQVYQVLPVQHLVSECSHPKKRRPIYQFQNNSPLIEISKKYRIPNYPVISLEKLSQVTNYPQIIMKNNFYIDTIVCDQKTTLVYSVLTSQMFQNQLDPNLPYENIILIHDMFDCFLQYLQMVKDLLQTHKNKRILLFNIPGQSYTIYDKNTLYDANYIAELLDKILFRVNHLKLMNVQQESFKICGIGYGGYIAQTFLLSSYNYFNIKKVMLINSYNKLNKTQNSVLRKLLEIYKSQYITVEENAYIYYNIVIGIRQQDRQSIQRKMIMNPINIQGRIFLINNILRSTSDLVYKFQAVQLDTVILHGKNDCFVNSQQTESFGFYSKSPNKKIPNRHIVQVIDSGHDIKVGNIQEYMKHLSYFVGQQHEKPAAISSSM